MDKVGIERSSLFCTGYVTPLLYRLFYKDQRLRLLRILTLILLPLITLSLVTYKEGVFFLGSLTVEVDSGQAVGMSFLGDTMVWPFCIIVPFVMIFTFYSLSKTKSLFDCVYDKVNKSWFEENGDYCYGKVHKNTEDILNYRKGKVSKFIKYAPVLIIILFWSYNTLTCGFNAYLGEGLYPYKTNKIVVASTVIDENQVESVVNEQIILDHKIPLPKWDCDFSERPLSCFFTRVWTLIYYGIPPFLLFKLINVLWALTYLLGSIKKWEKEHLEDTKETALSIEPYSGDGLGGLSALPEAGMAFFYNVSAFSFLIVMSFLKEGADPSWHNYLILIGFIPVMIWSLMLPTLLVRHSIVSSKEKFLDIVSTRSQNTFDKAIASEREDQEVHGEYYEKINALDAIYNKIDAIPEWPFSYSAISKIIMTFVLPVFALFWDTYLGIIVDKVMSLLGQ